MKKHLIILFMIVLALVVSGCSDKVEQPQQTAGKFKHAKKVQQIKPVLVTEEKVKPEYVVRGTRDPFQIYSIMKPEDMVGHESLDPLQKLSLSQLQLVGVIIGPEPRALVQDNSSIGYIIKVGTLVGENTGIVTNISQKQVTIKQHFKDYMGRVNTREVVMSLRKEEGEK